MTRAFLHSAVTNESLRTPSPNTARPTLALPRLSEKTCAHILHAFLPCFSLGVSALSAMVVAWTHRGATQSERQVTTIATAPPLLRQSLAAHRRQQICRSPNLLLPYRLPPPRHPPATSVLEAEPTPSLRAGRKTTRDARAFEAPLSRIPLESASVITCELRANPSFNLTFSGWLRQPPNAS
jgi:hypothetical protein